jgi:programmed cell death protein 5
MEEMRRTMLSQVLDGTARERLSRIAIVKPEKGRAVEDLILKMARSGQLRAKLNEDQLIEMLGQINQTAEAAPKKILVTNFSPFDIDQSS